MICMHRPFSGDGASSCNTQVSTCTSRVWPLPTLVILIPFPVDQCIQQSSVRPAWVPYDLTRCPKKIFQPLVTRCTPLPRSHLYAPDRRRIREQYSSTRTSFGVTSCFNASSPTINWSLKVQGSQMLLPFFLSVSSPKPAYLHIFTFSKPSWISLTPHILGTQVARRESIQPVGTLRRC